MMGVDCKVTLPGNVRVGKVAAVLGAAAGCPVERYPLPEDPKNNGRLCTRVPGAVVKGTVVPSMAEIVLEPRTVDQQTMHSVYYHFEPGGEPGTRLMMPRSTAFWIAVMMRVVDFFGGRMDFNDSDDVSVDYSVPFKSDVENCAQDGNPYYDLQDRIAAVKPVTEAEWRRCDRYAAYKIRDLQ